MPNKRSQLSRNYINVLFHHFFKKLDSHSLGSLRFPSPLNCSSAPPPHRPRPLGRHSSPLLLTCRIHGLMDELWRCKMAAQTMDGPTQRRTNEGGRERERERSFEFHAFLHKSPTVRNAGSLPRILVESGRDGMEFGGDFRSALESFTNVLFDWSSGCQFHLLIQKILHSYLCCLLTASRLLCGHI